MSTTFQINDLSFRYARESFNRAWENERSVEVALGRYFLSRFDRSARDNAGFALGGPVLEVGAVMPYYGSEAHQIIDLCDLHPKSQKINALDFDYTNRNVLCLSTIEHMHTKEYSNGSDYDSITFLNKVLTSASNYLITFPTQYNEFLTHYMQTTPIIPRLILRRINASDVS